MASNTPRFNNVSGVSGTGQLIGEINGVTILNVKKLAGSTRDNLLDTTYNFTSQTATTTATGNGWTPSGNHNGWANGAAAVLNGKTGGNWSSTTQTPISSQPSLVGSTSKTGWKCAGANTPTNDSGPKGPHNGSGGHVKGSTERYVYTEVSSGRHNYHHIMRSPGINYKSSMGSTDNNLSLEFYIHAWGINIGNLFVYVDNDSTSNHTNATVLAQFAGSHTGTYNNGETTITSSASSHAQVKLNGTANGTATWRDENNSWVKAEINLNQFRSQTSDLYIYFVYKGKTSYRGDFAIDDVRFVETE